MYKNLDECLTQIYKLSAVNIEPAQFATWAKQNEFAVPNIFKG